MDKESHNDGDIAINLVRELLAIEPDEALLKRLRKAAKDEDECLVRCLAGIQSDQFQEPYFEAAVDVLESRVRAYARGLRRIVRIRRNLPDRRVLLRYVLFSDLIVPPWVSVRIDWIKPSITILERPGGGAPADLDLADALKTILIECGIHPGSPARAISADSLPDGDEPDKLEPPRLGTQFLALLERCDIAMPMADELRQIYRGNHAKAGRRSALRVYYRQLIRAITRGG
jgi:hypothetical protein